MRNLCVCRRCHRCCWASATHTRIDFNVNEFIYETWLSLFLFAWISSKVVHQQLSSSSSLSLSLTSHVFISCLFFDECLPLVVSVVAFKHFILTHGYHSMFSQFHFIQHRQRQQQKEMKKKLRQMLSSVSTCLLLQYVRIVRSGSGNILTNSINKFEWFPFGSFINSF